MAEGANMKAAEKTYGGFITLLKWSVPILFIIVMLLLVAIAR